MVNIAFLVADVDLALDGLLTRLPVLQHLDILTNSLLAQKRDVLDGVDCSTTITASNEDQASRLVIAELNRISNKEMEKPAAG